MVQLGANRYGKAEVRVVQIGRGAGPDGGDLITDRNVSSSLSGDLEGTHITGDNANVLATDTQKNTVYALSKKLGPVETEMLGLELARHFVNSQEPITRARVAIEEYGWTRIAGNPSSFHRSGDLTRTTTVVHDEQLGTSIVSGIADLIVLNTTNSEFTGFPRDEYTTLNEAKDRMLATQVSATWRYRGTDVDWAGAFALAKQCLLGCLRRDLQLLPAADALRDRDADHRDRPGHLRGAARTAQQAPLPR